MRFFCSLIVLMFLIQILQCQVHRMWYPQLDSSRDSIVASQLNAFIKYVFLNRKKEFTSGELNELLNILKNSIEITKNRTPEFWLLRAG